MTANLLQTGRVAGKRVRYEVCYFISTYEYPPICRTAALLQLLYIFFFVLSTFHVVGAIIRIEYP